MDTCKPQRAAAELGRIAYHAFAHGLYPGTKLKKNEIPGLCCAGVMDAADQQDWGMEIHRNEGVEICWVEHGHPSFRVDGRRELLKPGDLTLTRPWQAHRHGDPRFEACRLHFAILDVGASRPHQRWTWPPWLLLEPADREELTRWLRGSTQTRMRAPPEIGQAFRRIARAAEESPRWAASELTVQLNCIVLGLFHIMRSEPAGGDARLFSSEETARRFFAELQGDETMRNHPWTLEEMAEECGMGVTRLCACARSLYNQSPLKLLAAWRLDTASADLRKEPDVPVTEIAFRNGFNSSQYFATCFRRRFHCSPRAWRAGAAPGSDQG